MKNLDGPCVGFAVVDSRLELPQRQDLISEPSELHILLPDQALDPQISNLQISKVTSDLYSSRAVVINLPEDVIDDRIDLHTSLASERSPQLVQVSLVGLSIALEASHVLRVPELEGLGLFDLEIGALDEVGHQEPFL